MQRLNVTKEALDQKREQFQKDKQSDALTYFQKNEKLSRQKTLEIFFSLQKMEAEAYRCVNRVSDSIAQEEFNVQTAYIADRLRIEFGITSFLYNTAVI